MQTRTSNRKLVNLVLKGVAVATGIAAIVLQTLGVAPVSTLVTLLSLGLCALAVSALQAE